MHTTFSLINTTKALKVAAVALAEGSTFFIDTEFECQGGKKLLCLLQISSGNETFLIDCVRLTAMDCLTKAVVAPEKEWVLHDGGTDVRLILEKFGSDRPPKVFDTQAAWGLLGPEHSVSLAYLIYRMLGIRVMKEHQADPWDVRPIPPSQLEYAASDIEQLPALREKLGQALEKEGKIDLIHAVSHELCMPQPSIGRKTLSMGDFRSAWQLDYDSQAALRFLVEWYNDIPDGDVPPGIRPQTLFLIARRMPESGQELAAIKGVPFGWAKKEGDVLMGRMIRAAYEAHDHEHVPVEVPPYTMFEEVRGYAWLTMVRWFVSERIGIAPEIAFPKWLMSRLQTRLLEAGDVASGLDELTEWRKDWLTTPYEECCRKLQPFLPEGDSR